MCSVRHRVTLRISRWNPVARGQGGKLQAAAGEGPVGSDEKSVRALALKGGEGRVDLPDCAGVEDMDLQPDSAGRCLHVPQCGLCGRTIRRIEEHGNAMQLT